MIQGDGNSKSVRRFGALAAAIVSVAGLCTGGSAVEEANIPIVLFDRQVDSQRLVSWFDLADPAAPAPSDMAALEPDTVSRILGVYNGMLFLLNDDSALVAVDTRTGAQYVGTETLDRSHVHEDGMIYLPPTPDSRQEMRIVDLRIRGTRTVALPAVKGQGGWRPAGTSADKLRQLLQGEPIDRGAEQVIPFQIINRRNPDADPYLFELALPAPEHTWGFSEQGWLLPQGDTVAIESRETQRAVVRHVWLDGDRMACIGTGLEHGGARFPVGGEPGAWHLFVLDGAAGSVQSFPLAALHGSGKRQRPEGAFFDEHLFTIDTRNMEPLGQDQYGQAGIRRLSEHFNTSGGPGQAQVMHSTEPLKGGRNEAVRRFAVDTSGTRVLLWGEGAVCYDIYFGYCAEADPSSYYAFADRRDLNYGEMPLPDGWKPLLETMARAEPVPVAGGFPTEPPGGRKERGTHYTLRVSADRTEYAPGASATLNFSLALTSDTPAWTEPPAPMFPMITGTFSGPATSVSLSRLPDAVPPKLPAPKLLRTGETLQQTLTLNDLEPGEYTVAAAYGGNEAAGWRGLARAQLVRFRVGEPGDSGEARLRHIVLGLLHAKNSFRTAPVEQELDRRGREAIDMVVTVLRETAASPEDAQAYEKGIGILFGYLYNRHLTDLRPFYIDMLKTGLEEFRSSADLALRDLLWRAKEESVRVEIQTAVKEAYADAEPRSKAYAMENFKMDAWPDLFESMKAQAVEGDFVEQRRAIDVLANNYLKKFDTFEGEFEQILTLILENKVANVPHIGASALERLYGRKTDVPATRRAIDAYRIRYPATFDQGRFIKYGDLWDMDWLLRAAEEPTEARFTLLLRSMASLEAHCGSGPPAAFPQSWEALGGDEAARDAYRAALTAWADCLREKPAPFRVPVLQP